MRCRRLRQNVCFIDLNSIFRGIIHVIFGAI
jgi:hypothetical protein